MTRAQWGNGYATEGARAALDYGFATLKQREIVALTLADNLASQRVMQRLGMCVLYRMQPPQANDGAAIR